MAAALAAARLRGHPRRSISIIRACARRCARFSEKLPDADVALLFYAGHGLQVAGKNYLVPVDAQIETQADLDFGTIDLDLVLRGMEADARTNIIFLDACRDNPLART